MEGRPEGEHFLVKFKKPFGIQVGASPSGVLIGVVESKGAAHTHNVRVTRGDMLDDDDLLTANTEPMSPRTASGRDKYVEVGDLVHAASDAEGHMVQFQGRPIEEVLVHFIKGPDVMILELVKGAAPKGLDEIKTLIETHAKHRFDDAEKFIVTLNKPMGIQIGDSHNGLMIGSIDEEGSAARWNLMKKGEADAHDIRVGDVILAASNKKGELVKIQDRPIDEIMTFLTKTGNIVKLQLGRLHQDIRMSDATATIVRHNTKREKIVEQADMGGDVRKYTCQQYDHPSGALEDYFSCFNMLIGLVGGPCGVWYCLNHKQHKCRRCYNII